MRLNHDLKRALLLLHYEDRAGRHLRDSALAAFDAHIQIQETADAAASRVKFSEEAAVADLRAVCALLRDRFGSDLPPLEAPPSDAEQALADIQEAPPPYAVIISRDDLGAWADTVVAACATMQPLGGPVALGDRLCQALVPKEERVLGGAAPSPTPAAAIPDGLEADDRRPATQGAVQGPKP